MSTLDKQEEMAIQYNYTLDPKLTNLLSDYINTLGPILIQVTVLILLVSLTISEIKVKLEARALLILLNKNQSSGRRVLIINFSQILFYICAVYLRLCSPELQAVAAYSLVAKLIQTDRQQIKVSHIHILNSLNYNVQMFLAYTKFFVC